MYDKSDLLTNKIYGVMAEWSKATGDLYSGNFKVFGSNPAYAKYRTPLVREMTIACLGRASPLIGHKTVLNGLVSWSGSFYQRKKSNHMPPQPSLGEREISADL